MSLSSPNWSSIQAQFEDVSLTFIQTQYWYIRAGNYTKPFDESLSYLIITPEYDV